MTTASSTTTSTNSMLQQAAQSILSGATGSSLDVNGLVSALVAAKTAGQSATITAAQNSDKTELSAIGTMKSALANLKSALSGLSDGSAFTSLSASLSGSGVTATTTTGAVAGTYSINVQQVATANQISSQAYASGATLGTGTVTIGLGSSSMSVTLDSTNNTLSGLAAAINNSTSNPGVSAAVVTAADGQHLVLTSKTTGASNTVTISGGSGVDAGLQTSSFTQVTAAQDAKVSISGNTVTSASNTITGALTGVTLTVTSAAVGTTQSLSLATNTDSITKDIQSFVSAYNTWISAKNSVSSYNTTTSVAGALLGDSMLNTAVNGIASIISGSVSTNGSSFNLAQIGVDLQHDGTLSLDTSKLSSALASSPSTVSSLFNSTNGIGQQLDSFINNYTASSVGQIDQRTATINADIAHLTDQSTSLTDYQNVLTAQYNAQFTALNNLMTQMENSKNYLNQLFGGNGSAGTLNKTA
ncbi:flagellar filament capping protein FliD [Trinickia caryophylli]|uniref:Flagellar hook-associated protein 2 n=1 Tax=Trinickia caryophylli TaxID=28094 RepID=A0A1X7H673_TRICW|nr:flagellar filament capping protein FliD [Trinickia caryophylli]PMS13306.1 flagellar hook protein FliD [Trinickia caryophylli]TRX19166.1 flagellar hook protein FliD [Trinickia caryophylli]WQE13536.1 flagellar filament capping protein FliD [Trinickia caryophylli]SMF80314.1 flagellar hook-associated protein 2 [Trinickia caryophylli]GLU33930.1 flagellar hook-associated protein 2 [Trinickia caryophylli]